jgi:hypothetical protein
MTQTTVVPSVDLWESLHKAGLVPEQCCDIIIEARVGDVVRIHYQAYPRKDDLVKMLEVIAAFVSPAKVVNE